MVRADVGLSDLLIPDRWRTLHSDARTRGVSYTHGRTVSRVLAYGKFRRVEPLVNDALTWLSSLLSGRRSVGNLPASFIRNGAAASPTLITATLFQFRGRRNGFAQYDRHRLSGCWGFHQPTPAIPRDTVDKNNRQDLCRK